MDLRLKNDAVFQIVGPSGSGKSMFVVHLLKHGKKYFSNNIKTIYWLMGSGEDGEVGETAKHLNQLSNVKFLNGFEDGWMDRPQQHDVCVIDDLFSESSSEKNFNNLFTKIARHRGVTIIFITQNMFHQGGQHRTRNLNVHYLVLFKNPRDCTAIDFISRQAFPNSSGFLVDAFKDAVDNKPHGYIFIDFTQGCPDDLRVRTNIFDSNMIVYKQS
jgi:hypothetical protein